MRTSVWLAALVLVTGCSEYDLTAPPAPEDGVIEEPETPDVVDDSDPLASPVAMCSSSPDTVRPPFETNTFIGSDSYDPEDAGIASWNWSIISAPQGSGATLNGSGADRGFTADQAGIYVAELTVVTTDGRVSEPCQTELNAIPAEALWIEMFWQYSGDDMDLHVLRPGGTPRSNGDCYFVNCDGGSPPDWGTAGQSADDPNLDLDDIGGTGPENINIGAPEFGTFTVFVHDHTSRSFSGANEVTVNIYIDGQLEWTDTRAISGEDSDTYFAEIDWPTAQIRSL
ncbi:MAG: hypothetical protein EP330_18095 [Deltaproteobacteria bacterium]|nr:MAG: hypothetical protein EP330_18095 [Deltaproteobacteria bacterium]